MITLKVNINTEAHATMLKDILNNLKFIKSIEKNNIFLEVKKNNVT